MVYALFKVAAKLFRQTFDFAKRYINDTYQITLFLNMARLQAAELELNNTIVECGKFLKTLSMLWISNSIYTVIFAQKMLRMARNQIDFRRRRQRVKEE